MVYAIPLRPGTCSSAEMIQEKEMFYQAVDAFGLEDTLKAWEPTWSRPVMLRWHMMRQKEPEPVATPKKPNQYREEVKQEVCAYVKKNGLKAAAAHWHKIPKATIFFWWNKHPSNPKASVGKGHPYPRELKAEVQEYLKQHGTTETRKKWPDINESTLYNWKWHVDQEKKSAAVAKEIEKRAPKLDVVQHVKVEKTISSPAALYGELWAHNPAPSKPASKEFTVKIGKIAISCPDMETLEQLVNKFGS